MFIKFQLKTLAITCAAIPVILAMLVKQDWCAMVAFTLIYCGILSVKHSQSLISAGKSVFGLGIVNDIRLAFGYSYATTLPGTFGAATDAMVTFVLPKLMVLIILTLGVTIYFRKRAVLYSLYAWVVVLDISILLIAIYLLNDKLDALNFTAAEIQPADWTEFFKVRIWR